jgi:hypothetical protein
LKVPPHLVRVKYKTTRSSGVEVDTPGTRRFTGPTSVFLGFSCGKLRIGAPFAGFCNHSFTRLSQTIAVHSRGQDARTVQSRFFGVEMWERGSGKETGSRKQIRAKPEWKLRALSFLFPLAKALGPWKQEACAPSGVLDFDLAKQEPATKDDSGGEDEVEGNRKI